MKKAVATYYNNSLIYNKLETFLYGYNPALIYL